MMTPKTQTNGGSYVLFRKSSRRMNQNNFIFVYILLDRTSTPQSLITKGTIAVHADKFVTKTFYVSLVITM